MDEIVLIFLNKNYRFSLSTHTSYKIVGRNGNPDISLVHLLTDISNIFSIDGDETYKIFEKWADYQTTLINNRITDILEKLHNEGVDVKLSVEQYNILLSDLDNA